jgi:putative OmpL-like beta-barrel porin-2
MVEQHWVSTRQRCGRTLPGPPRIRSRGSLATPALWSMLVNRGASETPWKARGLAVLTLAAIVAASPLARARAQDSTESQQQQKIDQLTQQIDQMKQQQDQLVAQLKTIKDQLNVKPPPTPEGSTTAAAPTSIGEHVAAIEKNITTNLGVSIHGLVDASYEANFNNPETTPSKGGNSTAPGGNLNQLRAWDLSNQFQLTQGNLHIERDGTVGFVTDLNFGQVANAIYATTRYSNATSTFGDNENFDATQFYLTYTAPVGSGINLQAGRMVTLLGAEVIPTYQNQNFNETRGLLFTLGEPLTHTGVRGAYTFNQYVGLTLGLNNGWDDVAANNYQPTLEGELALNNADKSISLLLNGTIGTQQVNHSNSKLGSIDPVFEYKPAFIPNFTWETEYLYAHEDNPVTAFPTVTSTGNSLTNFPVGPQAGSVTITHGVDWQGVAQYFVYDWNQWEFATRGEFFRDSDGARSGLRQSLWEITQTLTYKVSDTGLLARLEYRHDNSNQQPFNNNDGFTPAGVPFHTWAGQDTLTAAAIYAF